MSVSYEIIVSRSDHWLTNLNVLPRQITDATGKQSDHRNVLSAAEGDSEEWKIRGGCWLGAYGTEMWAETYVEGLTTKFITIVTTPVVQTEVYPPVCGLDLWQT